MMKRTLGITLATLLIAAPAAMARDSRVELPLAELVASQEAKSAGIDGSVRFYLQGQRHPAIVKSFQVDHSNKKTNAANKSDDEACRRAALSALLAFQAKAQRLGANAVVDIVSLTRAGQFKSATNFECNAGNILAGVALQGTYAKVK